MKTTRGGGWFSPLDSNSFSSPRSLTLDVRTYAFGARTGILHSPAPVKAAIAGAVWLEKIPKAKARQTEAAGDGEGSDVFACANVTLLLRSSDVFAASGESDVFPAQKSARGKFYYQKAGRNGIDAAIEPRRGGARSEPCRSKKQSGRTIAIVRPLKQCKLFSDSKPFSNNNEVLCPAFFQESGRIPRRPLFLIAAVRIRTTSAAAGTGAAFFAGAEGEEEGGGGSDDEDGCDDHGGEIRL